MGDLPEGRFRAPQQLFDPLPAHSVDHRLVRRAALGQPAAQRALAGRVPPGLFGEGRHRRKALGDRDLQHFQELLLVSARGQLPVQQLQDRGEGHRVPSRHRGGGRRGTEHEAITAGTETHRTAEQLAERAGIGRGLERELHAAWRERLPHCQARESQNAGERLPDQEDRHGRVQRRVGQVRAQHESVLLRRGGPHEHGPGQVLILHPGPDRVLQVRVEFGHATPHPLHIVPPGHGLEHFGTSCGHPLSNVPGMRRLCGHAGFVHCHRLDHERLLTFGVGRHLRRGHESAALIAEGTAVELPQRFTYFLVSHDFSQLDPCFELFGRRVLGQVRTRAVQPLDIAGMDDQTLGHEVPELGDHPVPVLVGHRHEPVHQAHLLGGRGLAHHGPQHGPAGPELPQAVLDQAQMGDRHVVQARLPGQHPADLIQPDTQVAQRADEFEPCDGRHVVQPETALGESGRRHDTPRRRRT